MPSFILGRVEDDRFEPRTGVVVFIHRESPLASLLGGVRFHRRNVPAHDDVAVTEDTRLAFLDLDNV